MGRSKPLDDGYKILSIKVSGANKATAKGALAAENGMLTEYEYPKSVLWLRSPLFVYQIVGLSSWLPPHRPEARPLLDFQRIHTFRIDRARGFEFVWIASSADFNYDNQLSAVL